MPEQAVTKTEQFNQATRSAVVLFLVGGFTAAFLSVFWTGKIIVSTDAYSLVLGVAMTWLFKSRDTEQQAREVKDAVKAAAEPASVAVAKAEERAAKSEEKLAAVVTPGTPTSGGGG